MPRGDQVLRQWKLLKMLQTRGEGIPLAQLATEMGVNERTIQRDFEVLEEIGLSLEFGEDEYGKRYWKLPHDLFKTGPFVLGPTEALSLLLAEQMFEPVAGTHLAEGLDSVLDKIRKSMPAKALEHFENVDAMLYVPRFGRTDHRPHAGKIQLLIEAAQNETSVRLVYAALWQGRTLDTLFDPYSLVLYDGNLYVLGWAHARNDFRILKVLRIQQIEDTGKQFEARKGFDPRLYFEDSFGIVHADGDAVEIVVKFTGKAPRLVEERAWHESQQLQRVSADPALFEAGGDDNGTVLATFRLNDTREFKAWIMGFGEFAEVLKPDWLRAEIRADLVAAARKYGG